MPMFMRAPRRRRPTLSIIRSLTFPSSLGHMFSPNLKFGKMCTDPQSKRRKGTSSILSVNLTTPRRRWFRALWGRAAAAALGALGDRGRYDVACASLPLK
eukprot:CAMPEP_0206569202 /NCGR_PEP_ID=MMETSP0325_2-20121206/26295_1 /ASSEMBLY_ACC=CAM_ASM_000347 /TAXON_ID=2866 /ORGANISM="Crypthecodinium cohnii, Strain Seligo" /LENGTH=99 /DNA_ID=CAMNT_0054072741 /DNA_START=256 /DNA_END=552 /DNA_ORIENTATION=-